MQGKGTVRSRERFVPCARPLQTYVGSKNRNPPSRARRRGTVDPHPPDRLRQVFYRRSGSLILHPRPVLTSPLDGEIQRLYFPALLTLVLEPVQALTDSVVVGRIGTPQLGALGLGTAVFQFVLGLFSVFIFATTTVVAEENAAMRSGDAGCAREDSGEGAGTRSEVGDSPATSDFHSTAGVASESSAVYRGTTLAVLVGVFLQLAILELSPAIMHVVSSADATIANLSNEYVHSRAYAAVPALVMMVGCGASRGHKDPWTPLLGSVAYGVSLAVFDVYFVWGCRMGLEGAGYAASISQWIGAATVLLSLRNNGTFRLEDFLSARSIPTASFVAPYLRMAGPLALSSSAALAPVLLSSSMATGLGPDQLAAHTVLRQISTFWIQLFMGFNATAHSLVASALGKRTIQGVLEGSRVVERTACVAVAASLPLATGLYLCREWLPLPFTDSGVVVNDVIEVLPLLLAIAPLDALSLAFEGSILGASDTTWIAQRSIASSSLSILALEALSGTESCSLFSIWACLALLRGGVLAGDVTRLVWPVRFK